MQLGSPKHKADFLYNLTKTFQENIWKDEIQILEFNELLGTKRTELASIDLKRDRKEFKSAAEGLKLQEKVKPEIEALQLAIAKLQGEKTGWEKRIELIKRYSEVN